MKPIKITNEHLDQIREAISEVEGRATVRRISAEDVLQAAHDIEAYFSIPKVHLNGLTVSVDLNAQRFANAYKYPPMSTLFVVEHRPTGWYLIDVRRTYCRSTGQRYVLVNELTKTQEKAILDRFNKWC